MIRGIDYRNISSNGQTQLKSGMELIEAELNMLFSIPKHSLFFGNNIGIDLEKYLSLSNKTAAFNLVRSEIEELFSKYKNSVQLTKLEITFDDRKNTMYIDINVTSSGRNKTLSFSVNN